MILKLGIINFYILRYKNKNNHIMKDVKRAKIKSTTLNLHNRINNKAFVTKTALTCNTCKNSIQENPVLCYMFIEFFLY